jgi:hypothetical protein
LGGFGANRNPEAYREVLRFSEFARGIDYR